RRNVPLVLPQTALEQPPLELLQGLRVGRVRYGLPLIARRQLGDGRRIGTQMPWPQLDDPPPRLPFRQRLDHGSGDRVLELPHVARPVVLRDPLAPRRAEPYAPQPQLALALLDEGAREQG